MKPVKMLAIMGGPRKQGNSDLLADRLLEAARAQGAQTRKEYVVDWDIHPICDSTACQEEDGPCTAPDEATKLMDLMVAADVVVFAAPLYWYGPPAQLKAFIDRWSCRYDDLKKAMKGRRAFLVHTRAEENPQAAQALVDMTRMATDLLGMKWAGDLGGVAWKKGEILKNAGALQAAADWGRRLAGAAVRFMSPAGSCRRPVRVAAWNRPST